MTPSNLNAQRSEMKLRLFGFYTRLLVRIRLPTFYQNCTPGSEVQLWYMNDLWMITDHVLHTHNDISTVHNTVQAL